MVQFCHLMYGYSLTVLWTLSPFVALLSFYSLSHLFVATSHCIPHSWIFWSWKHSSTEIVQRVMVHVLQFICLSKTIPCSEILRIDFYSIPVSFNSPRYIFQFQILMSHQSPSCQACSIKFKSFSKVDDGLQMFTHQRVVITNNTTCFRIVLVVVKLSKG